MIYANLQVKILALSCFRTEMYIFIKATELSPNIILTLTPTNPKFALDQNNKVSVLVNLIWCVLQKIHIGAET